MAPSCTRSSASTKNGLFRVWKSTRKHKLLLRGFLAQVRDQAAAGRVHGDGLGEIDMDSLFHGRRGLLRMEIGRRYDGYGLDAAFEEPLVGGQAREEPRFGDRELGAQVGGAVGEIIRPGIDLVAAVLGEELGDPRPPAAAADDPQLDPGIGLRAADKPGRTSARPRRPRLLDESRRLIARSDAGLFFSIGCSLKIPDTYRMARLFFAEIRFRSDSLHVRIFPLLLCSRILAYRWPAVSSIPASFYVPNFPCP